MPTPELSEHLWTGKGLVGLVRKGNLPGGGFQYKSGARESFVETKVSNSPTLEAARELAPDARSSLRLTPMSNHGGTREGAGRPAGSSGGRTVESRSVSMRSTDWAIVDQMRGSASRGVYLASILHRTWNAQQNSCSPAADP